MCAGNAGRPSDLRLTPMLHPPMGIIAELSGTGRCSMPSRFRSAAGFCLHLLIVILQALLITWMACAPIVWIVRDGLGPDSVETTWPGSVLKFLVAWTGPALLLAAPLLALSIVNRRLAAPADLRSP